MSNVRASSLLLMHASLDATASVHSQAVALEAAAGELDAIAFYIAKHRDPRAAYFAFQQRADAIAASMAPEAGEAVRRVIDGEGRAWRTTETTSPDQIARILY